MTPGMSAERYDAIVVGSGPNGLSAAITLAETGRSVLVVEAADHLGGAMATEELTLPGFHHDVFSAVYPAAAASPVFARWPLEQHGLRWTRPDVEMVHPLPGGLGAVLSRDLEETVASLERLAPGDGEDWRAFIAPYIRHFSALRATLLSGFPPISGPAQLLGRLGVQGTLEFTRLLLLAAGALGKELFDHPGSAAWLYGSALHGDVPPDGAGSAVSGTYLQLMGHTVGWPSPEGGAGRLAGSLVGHFESLGGRSRTGAPVQRLVVRRGRVEGVGVADQGEVSAPLVLCDVTPQGLLAIAGDGLPEAYARRMARFRAGPHTFKIDWALDGPVPWEHPDARRAGTVHVGGDAASIMEVVAAARGDKIAERPFLLFGQQSIADPTRAPEGKHTAWAYTHVPPDVDWAAERDGFTETVEAQVERFAPGFGDLIAGRHVMSPDVMQSRNRNLIGGDVGSGSYTLDQLVFRPVPSLSPYVTPVHGLYLCSASTFPGGAVHGVPGHAAARRAIADARLPGRLRLPH